MNKKEAKKHLRKSKVKGMDSKQERNYQLSNDGSGAANNNDTKIWAGNLFKSGHNKPFKKNQFKKKKWS